MFYFWIIFGIFFLVFTGFYIFIYRKLSSVARFKKIKELIDTGKYKSAIAQLSTILTFDRTNTLANYFMYKVYSKKHHYLISQMYLKDILNKCVYTEEVTEKMVREALAKVYEKIGKYERALNQYYLLSKKYPKEKNYSKEMAILYINQRKFDEAEILLYSLLKDSNFDSGEIYYLLGYAQFLNNKITGAINNFEKAVNNGYKSEILLRFLGISLYENRKYDEAIKYLMTLKDNIEAETYIGRAFFNKCDYVRAAEHLYNVIYIKGSELKRTDYNARYLLGCAYEKSQRTDKAIEEWRSIFNENPYHNPTKEKLRFYTEIVVNPMEQALINIPPLKFKTVVKSFLDYNNFIITEVLKERDPVYEYLAYEMEYSGTNRKFFYFYITRSELPVDKMLFNNIIDKARSRRAHMIVIIAPEFDIDETLIQKFSVETSSLGIFNNTYNKLFKSGKI